MAAKHRDGQIMPHHSVAFRLKCEREFDKLRAQLSFQLKNDMLKLLNEYTFSDLKFVVQGQELFAHSSILKVRVEKFYEYCLTNCSTCGDICIVELPGLKTEQLHNFFRAVYCNEEVELEEALVLKAIAKFTPISLTNDKMTTAPPTTANGLRPSASESLPPSSETSSPREDSLENGGARYQNRNETFIGNNNLLVAEPLDEQYSSSECLHHPHNHHTGTLADVTDPFSLSTPLDTFNVSTLNLTSGRASVASIDDDELNASFEVADAPPAAAHGSEDVTEPPKTIVVNDPEHDFDTNADTRPIFPPQRPSLVASFLARSKCAFEQDISVDSVDGTVPSCIGELRPRTEVKEREPLVLNGLNNLDVNGVSSDVTVLGDLEKSQFLGQFAAAPMIPEMSIAAEKVLTVHGSDVYEENQMMACSHESKEGDSGICSFNQRLSATSVSPPRFAASPAGSLPKDDSLEFCPDSLASSVNATTAAIIFGLASSPAGGDTGNATGDWLHLEEETGSEAERAFSANGSQVEQCNEVQSSRVSKSELGYCTADDNDVSSHFKMNGSDHRAAWAAEDAESARRWSLSSGSAGGGGKSHVKPSAIVMPYNIDDDDFVRRHPSSSTTTTTNPANPTDGSIPDEQLNGHGAVASDNLRQQAIVQLDFVPFLKETPQTAAANYHLENVYHNGHQLPPSTQHNDVRAGGDRIAAADWLDSNMADDYHDIFVDNAVHQPLFDNNHSAAAASNLESLPIITGYAPAPLLSTVGPTMPTRFNTDDSLAVADRLAEPNADREQSGHNRPFYSGFVNGAATAAAAADYHETEEKLLDCAAATSSNDDVTRRQKQEAFFMFIDVGKANGAANTAKTRQDLGAGYPEGTANAADKIEMTHMEVAEVRRDPPPSAEIVAGSREINGTPPPPPVYMFIEATGNESTHHATGHHVRIQARAAGADKHDTVKRRGGRGAVNGRSRPKSESAATLMPLLDTSGDGFVVNGSDNVNRADKRMSLGFDGIDDDDVTYSIENSLEVDSVQGVRGGEEKRRHVSNSRRYCSKLGDHLLRMFLDEINPDVTIWVGDKEIKAHKSILTARCVYFAAMLSGTWIEKTGNVIKLQGFSYAAVNFALRHIYGGAAAVPDELDLSELASLADMLGLEGLKEVVGLALKIKFCHFFHKPCAVCVAGISECLLIAASFGLDDLQESCLRWITRHQLKIWPTKAFAALPDDILHKCYLSTCAEMSPANVLDTLLVCDKLMATLPHVKWSEPVFALTTRLSEACAEFLAANFADVLRHDSFLGLRAGQSWNIHTLEATFLLAVERLPLEVACQAYVHLSASQQLAAEVAAAAAAEGEGGKGIGGDVGENPGINENYEALVNKIHRQVEHFLIHNANRIVRCNSWSNLSENLQKKIRDAAVIVFEFGKPTAPPPRLSSLNRKFVGTRSSTAASPSPSTERAARVAASRANASKSMTSSVVVVKKAETSREHHHHHNQTDKTKAATLPRVGPVAISAKKADVSGDNQRVSSPLTATAAGCSGAVARGAQKRAGVAGLRSSSSLVRDDSVPRADSDVHGRDCRSSGTRKAVADVAPLPVNAGNDGGESSSSAQFKQVVTKDKALSPAMPVNKMKEKNLVKDAHKDTKSATPSNGAPLRSAARFANGISKTSSPVPRPKSAGFTPSSNRASKQPVSSTNGGIISRDTKPIGIRKTTSSDLHLKDKDDTKTKTRPKSDDISLSSTSRKAVQRLNIARTSRPSTSKVLELKKHKIATLSITSGMSSC